jgi:hypothetical protein
MNCQLQPMFVRKGSLEWKLADLRLLVSITRFRHSGTDAVVHASVVLQDNDIATKLSLHRWISH